MKYLLFFAILVLFVFSGCSDKKNNLELDADHVDSDNVLQDKDSEKTDSEVSDKTQPDNELEDTSSDESGKMDEDVQSDNAVETYDETIETDADMVELDDEALENDDETIEVDDEMIEVDNEIADTDSEAADIPVDETDDADILVEEEEVEDFDDYVGFDEENTNDSEIPDEDVSNPTVKNILFAHGLNASYGGWSTFKSYAEGEGWTVYGTNVGKRESIEDRANDLADYINTLGLEENSLVVVGHSMGGLDLHYIISEGHDNPTSKFGIAATTFKKYYTIASPHKGNQFSGMDISVLGKIAALDGIDWIDMSGSDAVHDLGLKHMQDFNKNYPYTTFSINGRKIPALALRFSCIEDDEVGDGVVAAQNQSLNGAPHTAKIYEGAHMPGICDKIGVVEEQLQTNMLQKILDDFSFTKDVHDIVFYEGSDCSGDEKGVFSSRSGVTVSCRLFNGSHNDSCDNDEIRSVKIFPGVRKNFNIYVFDEDAGTPVSYDDDWAVINTGSKSLTEAVCINTFEQDTTSSMSSKGLSMFYHKGTVSPDGGWLDGKISRIQLSSTKRERIVFYEGYNCEQDVRGYYDSSKYTAEECDDYNGLGTCHNDEIKSVLIFPGVNDNKIIKLYDSSSGSLSEDWFFINRGNDDLLVPFCINGLEHDTSEREEDAGISTFFRDSGGAIKLNGKVSYVKIANSKDSKFVFYEGLNCEQQVKGLFEAGSSTDDYSVECDGYSGNGTCDNDEIRSLLIQPGVLKGKDIRVYDSTSGKLNDDYTSIFRGQHTFDTPFCINGFEHNTSQREEDAGIQVYFHDEGEPWANGQLNGKISYIKIVDEL